MTVNVKLSGPMFDGRAVADLQEGLLAARHEVANTGAKLTRTAFDATIRRNTGRFIASVKTIDETHVFESSSSSGKLYTMVISVDRTSETVVTTDIATYGPWLEGTGSRNHTTRFRGYHGFRLSGQALDRVAGDIAEAALKPYVQRMS